MRAVEGAAIESGAVTGLQLMERAGAGVLEAVFATWPDLAQAGARAVVLCGPGNNGGDGFVVARLLHAHGWKVALHLFGDPDALTPDAAENARRWAGLGATLPPDALTPEALAQAQLVVDALFGTGLTRPLDAPVFQRLARMLDDARPRVVAVDIASGLSADTGLPPAGGVVIPADMTVSFHRPKRGHVTGQGPERSGKLVIADIGLEPWAGHADDV
ncbi:NAD(P)H-hydrate epimerase [Rhabdonatronobacter sediminivivens]|uniref:NAD(P)H-hydrate epimerase n=1 Tax=Rhabdonatronobacter sediminivivens TaxID=2743469 RepID=UPI002E1752DE